MHLWLTLAPATPLVAFVGWGLLFMTDPSQQLRHAQAALQADHIETLSNAFSNAATDPQIINAVKTAGFITAVREASRIAGVGDLSAYLTNSDLRNLVADAPNIPSAPVASKSPSWLNNIKGIVGAGSVGADSKSAPTEPAATLGGGAPQQPPLPSQNGH